MESIDYLNDILLSKNIKKREFIKKLREVIDASGKTAPAEKTLYAKLSGGRRLDLWIIPYAAQVLGVHEQDLINPDNTEKLIKKELSKNPNKYLEDMRLRNTIRAEVMSATAAAGTGNHIESVDLFSTGEYAVLDERLFKTKPRDLKIMRVDGHSMTPMLYPDSWVAYEPSCEYTTDGLYVINYGNELMVKLLQYNPAKNTLEIISKNPDYKSFEIRPDDQSVFQIVGKVLRCII